MIRASSLALSFSVVAALSAVALAVHADVAHPRGTSSACPTGDCVAHRIDTQPSCTIEQKAPQGAAAGWHLGLATDTDQKNYGGTVVAYRIRWSNGAFSGWYAKGVNDLDGKVNPGTNTMRRQWSYFADHEHEVLICR
jgi:hypothetical protein